MLTFKSSLSDNAGLFAIMNNITKIKNNKTKVMSLLKSIFLVNYTKKIQPDHDLNSTLGGNSFRISVVLDHLSQLCPVKDYFNGTYLACCEVQTAFVKENFTISE